MTLAAGTRLGSYEIGAPLGAGGMGEVYRARDTRLGRDVAIKVLPSEVAGDESRLARFRREAHLLAAFNHPGIAAIHGLEEIEGQAFLALELVEGEELAQRLERGAIPLDEALEIAKQLAEALEEAHHKGIVHRDLKPANVKLTPDGRVKVLDFGLAKAWAGDSAASSSGELSQSPTLPHSPTLAGVILGTAAYMSPEQARGRPVDRRSDVWSFGVLLWEMLTGRPLFVGTTVTDILAAVVTQEVDLGALPEAMPPAVRRLIERCLRKDPRRRLPDIGAARVEIEDALAGSREEPGGAGSSGQTRQKLRRLSRQRWAWAAAFLVVTALAGWLAVGQRTRTSSAAANVRFAITPPSGLMLPPRHEASPPAVSPDGRRVAFTATSAGRTTLWIRDLDSPTSREIPRTDDATQPFWSPDGGSLAFFDDHALYRVDLADGSQHEICTLTPGFRLGGDWGKDGTILFSSGGISEGAMRIYTVPAGGGEPKPVPAPDQTEIQGWPTLVRGGRHLLFVTGEGLHVASLDAPNEARLLLSSMTRPQLAGDRLFFVRDGTLVAQPFDVTRGLTGEPRVIASPVAGPPFLEGMGNFSVSESGLLAYLQGGQPDTELVWIDRRGRRVGTVGQPGSYGPAGSPLRIALSPDESQVAVVLSAYGPDVFTIDLARGVRTRQTFDGYSDVAPVWATDGQELAFSSNRQGAFRLYRKRLRGKEGVRAVDGAVGGDVFPESWTADGKTLLYSRARGSGSGGFVGALPWHDGGVSETILERPYDLATPRVSPDGRWLAYLSRESGRFEVYVEPFRRPGDTVRVSPEGGVKPQWRADGTELFYLAPEGKLNAVEIRSTAEGLKVGLPEVLFDGVNDYAATRDGQRFLAVVPLDKDYGQRIQVMTNWMSVVE